MKLSHTSDPIYFTILDLKMHKIIFITNLYTKTMLIFIKEHNNSILYTYLYNIKKYPNFYIYYSQSSGIIFYILLKIVDKSILLNI